MDRPRLLPPDLPGQWMRRVALPGTAGGTVDLGRPRRGRTVLYWYPCTGWPGSRALPGWAEIPGARGRHPMIGAARAPMR